MDGMRVSVCVSFVLVGIFDLKVFGNSNCTNTYPMMTIYHEDPNCCMWVSQFVFTLPEDIYHVCALLCFFFFVYKIGNLDEYNKNKCFSLMCSSTQNIKICKLYKMYENVCALVCIWVAWLFLLS